MSTYFKAFCNHRNVLLLTLTGVLLVANDAQAQLKTYHTTGNSSRLKGSVMTIAHRGGLVSDYPENTLLAFRKAIEFGSNVVEIDLRSSKDGSIVILHDSTLDRTTNATGPLTNYTLSELKRLDAGMGERIPTYEEVLRLLSGTNAQLLLDLKVTSIPELTKIVRLTEKYGHVLNVIAAVRSLEELRDIQSLNPNIRTLAFIPERTDIENYSRAGVDIIRLSPDWIRENPTLVKRTHNLGNIVWTTSMEAQLDEIEEFIELGVNGVFTNFPEIIN